MFIFSAKNLGQTYRRMRYVREYATYQRLQGEEILKKQEQIRKKKAERQQVKAAKENLLQERESEKVKLEEQEKEKRTLVTNLQKKQKGLQNEINLSLIHIFKSKDVGHSRYIVKYRLYSFIEYGRFYIVLTGNPVDQEFGISLFG